MVLCDRNIAEIRDILQRKAPKYLPDAEVLLAEMSYELIPAVDHAEKLIRDAKDQPILNAAIVYDVDIILTGDKDFLMRWASLMSACVKNGTRIKIIHNVDRDLSEMTDAIKNWLPLYMSGMVESWYSTRTRNPRFSHTIFLCPGKACIESFHPVGTNAQAVYHYYVDWKILEVCRSGFDSMLEASGPLLKIPASIIYKGDSDITIIQNGLSVATMSEELVRSFNEPSLYEEWKTLQDALLFRLKKARVNECVTLADDEDLFSGKVRIEQLFGVRELFYTPEQYAMHLRNIIRLSETYAGYRFYALPETPFPNVKLMVADDTACIIHAKRPELSFGLNHPLVCRAYRSYAESLMEQHKVDRNTLRKTLESKCI
jgi:predicted nuclease of predicted toxin-antitoxin system